MHAATSTLGCFSMFCIFTSCSAPAVPTLMSFKDFIMQQEDDIDEVESVRRYQEYKVEFKRTQINDFFVLHKGAEWWVILMTLCNKLMFAFDIQAALEITSVRQPIKMIGRTQFQPIIWIFYRSHNFFANIKLLPVNMHNNTISISLLFFSFHVRVLLLFAASQNDKNKTPSFFNRISVHALQVDTILDWWYIKITRIYLFFWLPCTQVTFLTTACFRGGDMWLIIN